MSVSTIIRDRIDALLHPSARGDALSRARHRDFIAMRLIGGLAAIGALPIYLVLRGEPTALELAGFAWLIAPLLVAAFLSRTGAYECAHGLSSLALAGLATTVAFHTGGIESFAVVWLLLLPFEAALSGSRRVVAAAAALAACAGLALAGLNAGGAIPHWHSDTHLALEGFAFGAALIYGAGLAFASVSLSRLSIALRSREENRYQLLARHMSDVITRHGANGAVTFVSPAAETMIGARCAALLGHGVFDRVHVGDRPAYLTALSSAARNRAASRVEFRIRRDGDGESGGFLWVEMRCRPLEDDHGQAGVVAVMHDISDRKQQEQAIEAARAAAARAEESRSRFLAAMSHELRTPLNAIIGFSDMIAQEESMMIDAARRREYAQLINGSGQHLLSMVNSILDMSKMESGAFEIAPEPFEPRPAIANCCNMLALKARENGVELVTRMADPLPQLVGDPRAFKQIVLNLVSNAVKFTDRGGSVIVAAEADDDGFVLRVLDTGIGIAADDLCRIGDPFFQAGQTYSRRHEGTGLGLSIVKSLVALHGGAIEVDSALGKGTTVTVRLPREAAKPQSAVIATLPPPKAAQSVSSETQVRKSA